MSIPVFFNIEHYTMPQVFYYDKANFFMGAVYDKGFIHQTFNVFFEEAYKKGALKNKRKFTAKEIKLSEISYNDEQKILFIELPKPKKTDNAMRYLKTYCISFFETKERIEILDIYGIQKIPNQNEAVIVISFVKDDDKIIFRGILEDNKSAIVKYMYKVAFENYYPETTISVLK